ncbi:hypothetical protein F511_44762 [Dorcoceras hygrometricum]|uniref:Uncharacterized protein n=1 Tax=Dorcoceras hygrometricum TaxID=472368 RepID=A0A2Z7CV17_9LAMI|nr:hypothetical protein F511_44762 [Dorcoceras hygrometricum]
MHLLIFAFHSCWISIFHPADDDVTADVIIYTLALLLNILHLLIEMTSQMTSSTLNLLLIIQHDVASSLRLSSSADLWHDVASSFALHFS